MKRTQKIFLITFTVFMYAYAEPECDVPEKRGNFALPVAHQPGPLISFGQNIVDQGDLQFFCCGNELSGKRKNSFEMIHALLYGIRDTCSLLVGVPILWLKNNGCRSFGVGDLFMQGEYLFYQKSSCTRSYQMTAVGGLTLPTGSARKNPATGFGSPSFFIGATASYYAIDWLWFFSVGGLLTTERHSTKFGNELSYQGGFGRNIGNPRGCIVTWMVELAGLYAQRDRLCGVLNPNSGESSLTLFPSLFFSSDRCIVQAGAGYVVAQHQFGQQTKNHWLALFCVGWTFST